MNQNPVLYVLGNGFDLAHHLPTRYSDFLSFLQNLNNKTQNSQSDSMDLRNKISPDLKQYILENGSDTVGNTLNEISQIKHQLNDEWVKGWYCYFIRKRNKSNDSWIDFEKDIQSAITSLQQLLTESKNQLYIVESRKDNEIIKCFPQFHDFADLAIVDGAHVQIINPSKLYHCLYRALHKFTYCLELYLCIVKKLMLTTNKLDTKFFKKIISEHKPDYLLNFNYTDTFEKYYKSSTSISCPHYIHGKLRDNPQSLEGCNLVLGYSDMDSSVDNGTCSPTIWFEKLFQRILYKTGTDIYNWLNYEQDQHNNLITIFYGHSLDITDRDLLVKILTTSSRIIIYYHSDEVYPQLIMNLISLLGKRYFEEIYNSNIVKFIKTDS